MYASYVINSLISCLFRAYFEACDGIYLNYGWNQDKLQSSVENAEDREFDVYVGVDVFGRSASSTGGLETHQVS